MQRLLEDRLPRQGNADGALSPRSHALARARPAALVRVLSSAPALPPSFARPPCRLCSRPLVHALSYTPSRSRQPCCPRLIAWYSWGSGGRAAQGETTYEGGSYFLNYKGCHACKKSMEIVNVNKATEEDEDGVEVITLTRMGSAAHGRRTGRALTRGPPPRRESRPQTCARNASTRSQRTSTGSRSRTASRHVAPSLSCTAAVQRFLTAAVLSILRPTGVQHDVRPVRRRQRQRVGGAGRPAPWEPVVLIDRPAPWEPVVLVRTLCTTTSHA